MNNARERLVQAMDARRQALGMKWTDVATAAGMSVQNLLRIRNGDIATITPDAARQIEDGLRWVRDSVTTTLDGGEPTPLGQPPVGSVGDASDYVAGGVPVDEEGRPMTLKRIWAILEFVERNTDDPLAPYRALYDAGQKWGIPPAAGNQSRQAG